MGIKDDDNNVVDCDFLSIAFWKQYNEQRCMIAKTDIGKATVSTVFTGMYSEYIDVFETMVFATKEQVVKRYKTYQEAVEGHKKIVKELCNAN